MDKLEEANILASVHKVKTDPLDYAHAIKKILDTNQERLAKERLAERLNISIESLNQYLSLIS